MFNKKKHERGIALFMSLVILLLLSALAISLVYMANTDSFVSTNYRSQQSLYFAAKAGVEEGRNRLMTANAATSIMSPPCVGVSCLPAIPIASPDIANKQILYILGGSNPALVTPWAPGLYMDDELCHDGYNLGIATHSADVHCTAVPGGTGWYTTTTSTAPWNSTNAAMPYQWVRVAMKLNGSVDSGNNRTKVNPDPAFAANIPVCWDGTREILLPPGVLNCTVIPNIPANHVYLITALAVNTQTQSRRMVQAEVALNPQPPFPYGMFATGTGCSALQLGGGATTDSYTSAAGSNYATSHTNTGGDVGTNGNVFMNGSSTQIGGAMGTPTGTLGACPAGLTISGGAGFLPPLAQNKLIAAGPYNFPTPPPPVPAPPNTNEPKIGKTGANLLPGTYGNISVTAGGTITVAPGTYNINSISLAGNSNLVISPSGAVTFNVSGTGQGTPVDFAGGAITNNSLVANNFLINYGGTGTIKLSGNTKTYVTVNAPNADVKLTGGSDVFGAVIGHTITNLGGVAFHYDKNTSLAPQSNGYYTEIALRDIQY
jgi:hypothetical protein